MISVAIRRNKSRLCHKDLWNELRVLAHGCHVATILLQMCLREVAQHATPVALAHGQNIYYLSRHLEKFWFGKW